jgi:nicotinamidase-related amidase
MLFEKDTFASSQLYVYLLSHHYSEIELVGVVSNICVISNAVIAKCANKDATIVVDASCVASNDCSLNTKALDVMESFQVKIINRE